MSSASLAVDLLLPPSLASVRVESSRRLSTEIEAVEDDLIDWSSRGTLCPDFARRRSNLALISVIRSRVSDTTVPALPDRRESLTPSAQSSVESSTGVPTGYNSAVGEERRSRNSESSPANDFGWTVKSYPLPSSVALRVLAGRRVVLCFFGLLEFCRPSRDCCFSTWSAVNGHGPSMVTLLFLLILPLSPSFSRILRAFASRASRRLDRLDSGSSGSSAPPPISLTAASMASTPTHASLS
mmetsp:Transcript_11204/g.25505  ORF Transcript_11204/g.25505 Transcript_11204/m.25505 type:complete len:241 (-) Transcript_11204:1453-2175(-)